MYIHPFIYIFMTRKTWFVRLDFAYRHVLSNISKKGRESGDLRQGLVWIDTRVIWKRDKSWALLFKLQTMQPPHPQFVVFPLCAYLPPPMRFSFCPCPGLHKNYPTDFSCWKTLGIFTGLFGAAWLTLRRLLGLGRVFSLPCLVLMNLIIQQACVQKMIVISWKTDAVRW